MAVQESERRTIEQDGAQMAFKRAVRLLAGENKIHPVMHLKYDEISRLPQLTYHDPETEFRQRFDPRVHFDQDSGHIYTPKWDDKKTESHPETGKRHIPKDEYYTFLTQNPSPEGRNPQDLEKLPKSGEAKQLIYLPTKDIETAMRLQKHVMDAFSPDDPNSEPQQLMGIINYFDEVSLNMIRGGVTHEDLDIWKSEITLLVDKAKLLTAHNQKKIKIASMAISAMEPDKLGRINTPASRLKIRSARLEALDRIRIGKIIYGHYVGNLSILTFERNHARENIEKSLSQLSLLQERIFASDLSKENSTEMARTLRKIAQELVTNSRVAPYLGPSRAAAALLRGDDNGLRKKSDRKVLGEETTKAIYDLQPATFLISSGNLADASRNIVWAQSLLNDTLEAHAEVTPSKLIDVFSSSEDKNENSSDVFVAPN